MKVRIMTFDTELLKVIKDFQGLPKKDRLAIERQLSGLDKLNVKKVISSLESEGDTLVVTQSYDTVSSDDSNEAESEETYSLEGFSPWFAKELEGLLNREKDNSPLEGITSASQTALSDVIIRLNKTTMTSKRLSSENNETTRSFKSLLNRFSSEGG